MGLATVYRTIKGLVEEGVIKAVNIPGESSRYEISGKGSHHHFSCRKCGGLFEIECNPAFPKRLTPKGFVLEGHHMTLYGLCAKCKKGSAQ